MKLLILPLITVASNVAGASAQAATSTIVAGICTNKCAVVAAAERMANQDGQSGFISLTTFSWAQGFMSGVDSLMMVAGHGSKNLDGLHPIVEKQGIEKWCQANPDRTYASAVSHLFSQLPNN